MLSWWIWTRLNWTLWSITLRALKEELYFFSTASFAICTGIASHSFLPFLILDVVYVDGNRYEVLELHLQWLQPQDLLLVMNELQFPGLNQVP
jgi:hypothetical protein